MFKKILLTYTECTKFEKIVLFERKCLIVRFFHTIIYMYPTGALKGIIIQLYYITGRRKFQGGKCMDFDEIPLDADELAPAKPYTAERAEEIAEINGEIASLFAEING